MIALIALVIHTCLGSIVGLCYDQLAYDEGTFHSHGSTVDAVGCRDVCVGRTSSTLAPRQPDTCYCGPMDDSGTISPGTFNDEADYDIPSDWPAFGSLVSSSVDPIAAVTLSFDTLHNMLTVTIVPRPGLANERWTDCAVPCNSFGADATDWQTVDGNGIRYNVTRSDGTGGPVAPFDDESIMSVASVCAPFAHVNTYYVVGTFLADVLAPPTPAPTPAAPPTPSDPPTTPVPTPSPTQPPTPAAVAHIGCTNTSLTMALDGLTDAGATSVSACASFCRAFPFMGLRNEQVCVCLADEPPSMTNLSQCDEACDGASADSCAAVSSGLLALYRTGGPITSTEESLRAGAARAANEGTSRAPSDHGCFLAAGDVAAAPPFVAVGGGWRTCTTLCHRTDAPMYAFANPGLCACLNSTQGWVQRTNEPPSCRQQCTVDAARLCAVGQAVRLHSVADDYAVFATPQPSPGDNSISSEGNGTSACRMSSSLLVLLGVVLAMSSQ